MGDKASPQLLNKEQEESADPYLTPPQPAPKKTNPKQKKDKGKNQKGGKKDDSMRQSKKEKKAKKKKQKQKKRKSNESDQDDERSINSMFDEEAESGAEGDDYDDEDLEAEQDYLREKQHLEELYKRPNAAHKFMMELNGKSENEINARFSKRARAIDQEESLLPTINDPKIFIVSVKPNSEDNLVLCILNKAKHCAQLKQRLKIISVISIKKKYPGKIFVEAFSVDDVYEDLRGFDKIYFSKKIVEIQRENYLTLLSKAREKQSEWKVGTFVRINTGLYEQDLAKIVKVKKSSVDVLIVPRINVFQIATKIEKQLRTRQLTQAQSQQLLNIFINPLEKNYKQRPGKRLLQEKDLEKLREICLASNIKLAENGLILLNFSYKHLDSVYGTYLPIEIMPFFSEGNFIDEIKGEAQNLAPKVHFQKGQEVQIIAGDLQKHYGILVEVREKVGVMKCRNKELKNQLIQQPLENFAKKFRQGQRVKIASGIDEGKVGTVLSVEGKLVQIMTNNEASIKVNKRNLQFWQEQSISKQNALGLKRLDLIKTNKNVIGLVLSTSKDTISIINSENTLQHVNNLDFDMKIEGNHLVARNCQRHQFKKQSIILINKGTNKSIKCRVVGIYRQHLFLFNEIFKQTGFITVEEADNCSLVFNNKNWVRNYKSTNQIPSTAHKNEEFEQEEKEIKVGQSIILRQGALKGYQGIVKTITKQKIQVRIPSKSITEWFPHSAFRNRPVQQFKAQVGNKEDEQGGSDQEIKMME